MRKRWGRHTYIHSRYQHEAKIIGESLDDGDTYRGDCPACGGRNVFTVTRDGESIVWNCYRASCDNSGRSGGRQALLVQKPRKEKAPKPFTGELEELDESWKQYLDRKIGWTARHLEVSGAKYARGEDRVAYPIYGPMGSRRGWVLRSYASTCLPRWKSITRMDVAEPHTSWYRLAPAVPDLVVVEDIPSAVRASVASASNVVAMCGGGIGPDYVQEITAYARHITWAFDPDATAVAIRHHRKYGIFFESSRVLALERDFKDMTEEELCSVLREADIGVTIE